MTSDNLSRGGFEALDNPKLIVMALDGPDVDFSSVGLPEADGCDAEVEPRQSPRRCTCSA